MFSHQMLGSNDLTRSKTFYDALFTAIGGSPGIVDERGRIVYAHNGGRFLVTRPINGEPATVANGSTTGFALDNAAQVDRWHAAGIANGGFTCEDPPGIRHASEGRKLYLAYLRDPDGNKLCALHRISED